MNLRKVINKRIRHAARGLNVAGDVKAVIAANVGKGGESSQVSSHQRTRVVQRGGRTYASSEEATTEGAAGEQPKRNT